MHLPAASALLWAELASSSAAKGVAAEFTFHGLPPVADKVLNLLKSTRRGTTRFLGSVALLDGTPAAVGAD